MTEEEFLGKLAAVESVSGSEAGAHQFRSLLEGHGKEGRVARAVLTGGFQRANLTDTGALGQVLSVAENDETVQAANRLARAEGQEKSQLVTEGNRFNAKRAEIIERGNTQRAYGLSETSIQIGRVVGEAELQGGLSGMAAGGLQSNANMIAAAIERVLGVLLSIDSKTTPAAGNVGARDK